MARITCLGGPGRARRKEAAAAEGGGAPVDWDELLSAREKQQLALARLFHHKVASPRPPGPAPLTFKSLSSALGATGSADAHCIDVRRRCRRASDARGPARAAQPAFTVLDESMTGLGELERRVYQVRRVPRTLVQKPFYLQPFAAVFVRECTGHVGRVHVTIDQFRHLALQTF